MSDEGVDVLFRVMYDDSECTFSSVDLSCELFDFSASEMKCIAGVSYTIFRWRLPQQKAHSGGG